MIQLKFKALIIDPNRSNFDRLDFSINLSSIFINTHINILIFTYVHIFILFIYIHTFIFYLIINFNFLIFNFSISYVFSSLRTESKIIKNIAFV